MHEESSYISGPRRFLPSIAALRALEAVDRLGSATAAAAEMSLTQGAVSRQLQALEAQMGVALVARDGRALSLTKPARAYAAEIRGALQTITQASLRLQVPSRGGALNLAILPTFGMRWLVPRLGDFTRRHPEVTVNLTTRLEPFSFASEPFDAAIFFGQGAWPGTGTLRLRAETVLPVCAPSLVPADGMASADEVLRLPLLHIRSRPKAWDEWLAAQGAAQRAPAGTVFDQFSALTEAALYGLGVALLPTYLVEQDLAAGRLVSAFGAPTESEGAYWLVWPEAKSDDPALRLFRDWLGVQAEDEDPLPR